METVCVKFQEDVLRRMDQSIKKHNFNSRTEFIREAIRDKLSEIAKEELIRKFLGFRGKLKGRTRPEDDEKHREEFSRKLLKELDERFK